MPEKMKQNLDASATAGAIALERLGTVWCQVMHDAAMWPVHGEYECRSCGRHYPVPWAESRAAARVIRRPVLVLQAGGRS
jgi:hypothetical protein